MRFLAGCFPDEIFTFTNNVFNFLMFSLSGLSPLLGEDNNETLANVTAAEWDFDDESFDVISDEAKDFIAQLLVKNARYVQGYENIVIEFNKAAALA